MKKIITSDISTTVGMPLKSGTIDHLQSSYQEALNYLAKKAIGEKSTDKVCILYGCINSGDTTDYDISEGAVYYQGEIYLVPAATFSVSGGDIAVGNIVTSYFTATNADPVTFTDSNPHNIHEIRQVIISGGTSGSGLADYVDFVSYGFNAGIIDPSYITITEGTSSSLAVTYEYQRIGDMTKLDLLIIGDSYRDANGRFSIEIICDDFLPSMSQSLYNVITIGSFSYFTAGQSSTDFNNDRWAFNAQKLLSPSVTSYIEITSYGAALGQATIISNGTIFYKSI